MINARLIARVLGSLLFLEALMLMFCYGLGLFYGEEELATFGLPALLAIALGALLKISGRKAENRMSRRDGYLIVSLTWLLYTFIGMFPFLLSGAETRVAAAFFETMSGWTTTGSSVLTDIDSLPRSLLFWRSLTHWFGGMGIVFFTIAVLPTMGIGDQKLFSAEATGLKTEKLHPRISTTARWLWSVYLLLTGACCLAYYLCGMNLFDAVNHSLSTIATGGFSTHQASMAWFNSPTLEYVATLFMFISSINFTLLYLFFIKRRWRDVFRDSELRCLLYMMGFTIVFITLVLYFHHGLPLATAFRYAAFNTVSLQSTTGMTVSDFTLWHPSAWMMLLLVTAVGSCAGSTAGGIKCIRIVTAYKMMTNELRRILHPRAVLPVRINGNVMSENVGHAIFAFFVAYFLLIFVGTLLTVAMGVPVLDALSACISSFSNAGPAFGHVLGPLDAWNIMPDGALWVNSLLMLAGRLEIFSLLLPFTVAFWRDN